MLDVKDIIAINLRFIRYQSGKSQEKFYESHGVSPKYFSSIERGEINIGVEMLQAMSRTFHVSMAELVTFDESKIISKKRVDEKEKNSVCS